MLAALAAAIGEVTTPVVLSTGCMITGCAGGSDAGTCDKRYRGAHADERLREILTNSSSAQISVTDSIRVVTRHTPEPTSDDTVCTVLLKVNGVVDNTPVPEIGVAAPELMGVPAFIMS